jgi:hypothetical protein
MGIEKPISSPSKPASSAQKAKRSPKHAQELLKSAQESQLEKDTVWREPALKADNLLTMPTERPSKYLNDKGETAFDDAYLMQVQWVQPTPGSNHPRIREAQKTGNYTRKLRGYWEGLHPKVNIPLAGNPKESPFADPLIKPEESEWPSVQQQGDDNVCLSESARLREAVWDAFTRSKWAQGDS